MFSARQKREIAEAVQRVLRETNHPELPQGEISFTLSVKGAEPWSWAEIRNNGAVTTPDINPHNEAQDSRVKLKDPNDPDRALIERGAAVADAILGTTPGQWEETGETDDRKED